MNNNSKSDVVVLGVFVADVSFRANRQPLLGETILGNEFRLGPGGKGANQSVAIARQGTSVDFITVLGKDDFAAMALQTWEREGVTPVVTQAQDSYTGAAYIFIEEETRENAIIVCPGAAALITPEMVAGNKDRIKDAKVFMTQLEQPEDAAFAGLKIAKEAGVITILNPAPAMPVSDAIFPLCDYVTPNETETETLTGVAVTTVEDAKTAAKIFLEKGVGTAVITLGENGILVDDGMTATHIPAFNVGTVVETTGAGDAFNGGMASTLARGLSPLDAMRFGCAVAGISVTRAGTAPSMPSFEEAEKVYRS